MGICSSAGRHSPRGPMVNVAFSSGTIKGRNSSSARKSASKMNGVWFSTSGCPMAIAGLFSVLTDLAPLHDDIAGRLDVHLAGAVERQVLPLDGDVAVLLHRDAGLPRLDHDLVADVDLQFLADLDHVVL